MISSKWLLLIIVFTLILGFGCSYNNVSNVNNFSIYSVRDLTTTEAMSKNIEDLPLENIPVLTDEEIRTYNWKKHVFTLKEGFSLVEKLEGKVPISGKPFVVVADSKRIYLGSFWTPISSLHIPEIPTIDSSIWFKSNDKDIYIIEYGYEKHDPRDDMRIYESLKGLGKTIDE